MKTLRQLSLLLALTAAPCITAQTPAEAEERLTIGITLHPYYSFVSHIVGGLADVRPLIEAGSNPHNYDPQPADLLRARELDALVLNGIGHDPWAEEIVQAAGNPDLRLIRANTAVSLIPSAADDSSVNAHTFISLLASIQQIYEIARQLGELDPANADTYQRNARDYAARLRRLKAEYTARIAALDSSHFRAATMHGAYGYLMQEFGLTIHAVIEPRHGVEPTARQLAQTLDAIRASGVNVLFAEKYFAGQLAETIQAETGVQVFSFSHISDGPFTAERFEEEMRANLESLAAAIAATAAAQ